MKTADRDKSSIGVINGEEKINTKETLVKGDIVR